MSQERAILWLSAMESDVWHFCDINFEVKISFFFSNLELYMLNSITDISSDCTITLHLAGNKSHELFQCRARQRMYAQPPNMYVVFHFVKCKIHSLQHRRTMLKLISQILNPSEVKNIIYEHNKETPKMKDLIW